MNTNAFAKAFVALTFSAVALPAMAGVGKLSSPAVTKGEVEVEYSGTRYGDSGKASNNKQSHTYELEYGLTDNFMLGIEAKSSRKSGQSHEFSAYGIEAQYELTQQGAWWLATAVKGEYAKAVHDGDADEIEVKWLASRSYGASNLLVNIGLERELGDNRAHGVTLTSALQASHAFTKHFAPGFEWHAEHGKLNKLGDGDVREHYLGPIVKGELFDIGRGEVNYTAGYYWGLNDDSADTAARLHIAYEVAF